MELTLTTPALLFPTVSLILLAFTNRFLAVAALIRKLANDYHTKEDKRIADQIRNLRVRLRLIRDMQMLSIVALFLSVLSMFFLFSGEEQIAKYIFGASLISLLISLGMCLREIQISTRALSIQLKDIGEDVKLWDPLKDLVSRKKE
jgi:Na+/H+-translocating membrane pyrophosphatase